MTLRLAIGLVLAALVVVQPTTIAAQCAGDCDGGGTVSVAELVRGVNIALGIGRIADCPAFDVVADGRVSVDELVRGVDAALTSCGRLIAARGMCRRPGSTGLVPCPPDTPVRVSVCENRETCLNDPGGLRVIGFGRISANGQFEVPLDPEEIAGAALVFEADVEPATSTTYRVLAFGILGSGAGAGSGFEQVVIDPNTEAAVQLIDEAGFENLSDSGAANVIETVMDANADVSFAGIAADAAVTIATSEASQDPTVVMAIENAMVTPTPTPTATFTPTPTPIPRLALVTNFDDDSVSIVDARANTVLDTVLVGDAPAGVAVTADGNHALVANEGTSTASEGFSLIDTRSRTVVRTFPDYAPKLADGPTGVAINAAGRAFVVNRLSRSVDVIDVAQALVDPGSARVVRINDVGLEPNIIVLASSEPFAYATLIEGRGVVVINTSFSIAMTRVPLPSQAIYLALSPDDDTLYVTRLGINLVAVIDTATARSDPPKAVIDGIEVGADPVGVAFAPAGDFAYVANSGSRSLSVIDTTTRNVVSTVPFGPNAQPTTIAIAPDGLRAYVCDVLNNALIVVDTALARSDPENAVVDSVPVGQNPQVVTVFDLP